ncbi:MAG TPA: hypothetical protein PKA88_28470, partial [Polyangiaceae bacterium]|nr:hypothetical protein [Polyangiaceae bacterium]
MRTRHVLGAEVVLGCQCVVRATTQAQVFECGGTAAGEGDAVVEFEPALFAAALSAIVDESAAPAIPFPYRGADVHGDVAGVRGRLGCTGLHALARVVLGGARPGLAWGTLRFARGTLRFARGTLRFARGTLRFARGALGFPRSALARVALSGGRGA